MTSSKPCPMTGNSESRQLTVNALCSTAMAAPRFSYSRTICRCETASFWTVIETAEVACRIARFSTLLTSPGRRPHRLSNGSFLRCPLATLPYPC
jgi:hypothetical protein